MEAVINASSLTEWTYHSDSVHSANDIEWNYEVTSVYQSVLTEANYIESVTDQINVHQWIFSSEASKSINTDKSFSSSNFPSNGTRPDLEILLVVGMVTTMSVAVIGSIGNLLALATIFHQFQMPRRMRHIERMTANHILIVNLCLADLLYSCVSLPNMFINYHNLYYYYNNEKFLDPAKVQPIYEVSCKWSAFIRYTNAFSEWTTLGLMALERCVTIYRFQRKMRLSKWFSPTRTLCYCISVWLLGLALQTPTLLGEYGEFGYNVDTLKCDFMPTTNATNYFLTPRTFFFSLESAVPCCLILVGYVIILNQVYNRKRILACNNSLTTETQITMALRRSKTTRLIVLLLTVYLLCVIPICIFNVAVPEYNLHLPINQDIGICLYCLYWMQYSINNFIYVVSNEKYRNAYKQLFSLVFCRTIEAPPQLTKYKLMGMKSMYPLPLAEVQSRIRIRTPSEMNLEEECPNLNNNCLEETATTEGNDEDENNIEVPILIFPKVGKSPKYLPNKPKNVCPLLKTICELPKNAFSLRNSKFKRSKSHVGPRMSTTKTIANSFKSRRRHHSLKSWHKEDACKLKRTMSF